MSEPAIETRSVAAKGTSKTSRKPAKVASKGAAKQVAAKAAGPQRPDTRSSAGKPVKAAAKKPPAHHAALDAGKTADSPAQQIDARIRELGDWRGETLARIRILIKHADPEVVEEWKWRGVPVWSHAGMICTGETYRNVVKMTFAKGASLADPSGLFNSSLEGNTRRAIDFHEGDKIDEKALQALIRAAVALNTSVRGSARPLRSEQRPKSA